MKRVNETYFQFHLYRNVLEAIVKEISRGRPFLQGASDQYLIRSAANLNLSQVSYFSIEKLMVTDMIQFMFPSLKEGTLKVFLIQEEMIIMTRLQRCP